MFSNISSFFLLVASCLFGKLTLLYSIKASLFCIRILFSLHHRHSTLLLRTGLLSSLTWIILLLFLKIVFSSCPNLTHIPPCAWEHWSENQEIETSLIDFCSTIHSCLPDNVLLIVLHMCWTRWILAALLWFFS